MHSLIRYRSAAVLAALALCSTAARADFIWPALMLEVRSFSWWAISSGLLLEWLVIRRAFAMTWKRSAAATVVANLVSSLLGLMFIPFAGIAWEFFPAPLYMRPLQWGTFNPITWLATYLMAVLINTFFEAWVYQFGFKSPVKRREAWMIVLANALSVGVAFVSLFVWPGR